MDRMGMRDDHGGEEPSGTPQGRPSVDRCVCRGVPFSEVLRHLDDHPESTVDGIAEALGMGDRCGMCIPYIGMTVRTGRSSHHLIPQGGGRGGGDGGVS
jgi:bacterioferritin-associated ferredoxin